MSISHLFCFTLLLTVSLIRRMASREVCDMEEFDDCAKTALIFGDRDALIPRDMEEMKERCLIDRNANNCWRKNVRNCLKEPLTRQVLLLVLQSVERMVRLRCYDEEYQKEYFNAINCIYKVKSSFNDCMDLFIQDLHFISKAERKLQIPLACCLYNKYTTCAVAELKEHCGERETTFALEFLDGYAYDTLGLMCGGYLPGSPSCKNLVMPTIVSNETIPQSLIPPIITILSGLTKND